MQRKRFICQVSIKSPESSMLFQLPVYIQLFRERLAFSNSSLLLNRDLRCFGAMEGETNEYSIHDLSHSAETPRISIKEL